MSNSVYEAALLAAAPEKSGSPERTHMNENRKAARWRQRRIIYNNDGDDVKEVQNRHEGHWQLMERSGGELIDDFLAARTTSLVGTQVDSIWYSTCTAGVLFTHDTKLGGYFGKGVSQELLDTYGRDNLQIQVDYAHENNLEVFWSLRMNDTHDSHPQDYRSHYCGQAPFKTENPHYLLGEADDWYKYPDGPRHWWSSLDFTYPEVREHLFSLIEEVCRGYDVDGIELDFLRHPRFFPPTTDGNPVDPDHLEMMTDLVRQIRKMADEVEQERGRPLLLAARTPFALTEARFVGLDVEQWLAEDLIDLLIAGGLLERIMTAPLKEVVELGHRFEVPVYPCVGWPFWRYWSFLDLGAGEHRTFNSWVKTFYGGHPNDVDKPCYIVAWNSWEGTTGAWRGAAMNAWNAGADGIYVFNGFHSTPFDRWREIGDPKTLANKAKVFGVDRFPDPSNPAELAELELIPGEPVSAHFQIGEDLTAGNLAELRFRLHLWDFSDDDEIEVKLNGVTLDDLKRDGHSQTSTSGQWLECQLTPEQANRGENIVELMVSTRDAAINTPLVVDAVQIHVR